MIHLKVTSPLNPLIKEALRIKVKHAMYKHEAFLIEGHHLVEMAATSKDTGIKKIFFTSDFALKQDGQRLLSRFDKSNTHLIETTENILSRLSDTKSTQGIVAVVSYKRIYLKEIIFRKAPFLVVCDGIQDPGNLGTIIRTSDAAGADAVIIMPETCNPFMPKALRSTAGSIFNIPVIYSEISELSEYCLSRGIDLYITDMRAKLSVFDVDLKKPLAMVFGNEARGASNALRTKAEKSIKIPIIGKAESLNVAMAASICLYETVRQRLFEVNKK